MEPSPKRLGDCRSKGHGFSRPINSGVGEGFRQMGDRLLAKGTALAVPQQGGPMRALRPDDAAGFM
jgi:hypothetical protein